MINMDLIKNYVLLIFAIVAVNLVSYGQSSKEAIDYLKTHLTYPKYNKGDTVYIWYQSDEAQSIDYQNGVIIRKCTIVDIALVNGGLYKHDDTFSLLYCKDNKDPESEMLYNISFNYQLLPCDVPQRMGNLIENLRSEESLFKTYNECLMDYKKRTNQ